jgi:hypothetical protein
MSDKQKSSRSFRNFPQLGFPLPANRDGIEALPRLDRIVKPDVR